MLIEAGVDTQTVDETGKGALVYAAGHGAARDCRAVARDCGLDVDRRYGNDLTALMWAAGHSDGVRARADGLETVELLLSKGAAIDLADNRGRTALMIAAERGHAEIVKLLLSAGVDESLRDKDGKTAFDLAGGEAVKLALAP